MVEQSPDKRQAEGSNPFRSTTFTLEIMKITRTSAAALTPYEEYKLGKLNFGPIDGLMYDALRWSLNLRIDQPFIFIAKDEIHSVILGWSILDISTVHYYETLSFKKPRPLLMTYIDERFRRKGIGSKLVNHAVKELSMDGIEVGVLPSDGSSVMFFEKNQLKNNIVGWKSEPVTIDI